MTISRRRVLTGGAAMGAGAIFAPGLLGSPARADTELAISCGKVDITPSIGEFLAGWGLDIPRAAEGVSKPLYARCTIIWDNGFPNVIVTADTLVFPRSMNLAIRNRVAALGVANSDFILTATHTHNGGAVIDKLDPYMAYNLDSAQIASVQNYSDWLADQIVVLVAETLTKTRTQCTLDYQVLDENFAMNREGLPYIERDVPTLVARSLAGEPLAVMFGYGCHPITYGPPHAIVDPDYPGVAIDRIEQATGAFAQFILGPAGDQNPTAVGDAATSTLGTDLGQTIVNALTTVGHPVTGPISTAYTEITLPLDITDTPANLTAVKNALRHRLTSNKPGYVKRHASAMLRQIDAHSFATTVPLPLQVWKFPGTPTLRLAFTGGELVSGYAVHLRSHYGGSNAIWVAGYANEVPAYIPSDETDYPGIGGGSMCVYGYLGKFKGRPLGTTDIGVEQILINNLTAML